MRQYVQSICLTGILLIAGCATTSHAERGALVGSGLGAATGAVIGHQSGNDGLGAVLGATTGAMAGGMMGENQDLREERDAAIAQINYQQSRAITNAEVVSMVQNGVGDQLIISAIQKRGGNFSTDPQSIIFLKQQGVSESVMQAMLNAEPGGLLPANSGPVTTFTESTVVVPRTRVVISPGLEWRWGRRPRHRHPHRWH